jgi:nitrogen fixation/metabolism regulation signal transduction histidine kinase
MVDSYDRIQQHLGTVLERLLTFQARAARNGDKSRDVTRSLDDLEQLARQLEHAFDALKAERRRLKGLVEDADTALRRARCLFVESPSACVVLHRESASIIEANTAASRLLNVSQRHLVGKSFTNFLQQDRDAFLLQLQHPREDTVDRWEVTLRPRERATMQVRLTALPDEIDKAAILLSPAGAHASEGVASVS